MIFTLRTLFVFFALLQNVALSIDLRFDSGLPKAVSYEGGTNPLSEGEAIEKVMDEEFQSIKSLDWRLSRRQEDRTHVHLTYDLYFQDVPVFFQHLKIHFNKAGFVDYVTNTLQKSIEVPIQPSRSSWEEQKEMALAALFGRTDFTGISKGKLGIWLDENQDKAEWALDVRAVPRGPNMLKRGLISVENPRVLDEKQVMRHWEEPEEEERTTLNLKAFVPYPAEAVGDGGTNQDFSVGSQSGTALKNNYVYVRFDRSDDGTKYTDVGSTNTISFSPVAANYQTTCSPSVDTCPNQRVDSGNVYYHLTKFRNWLDDKASDVGTTLTLSYDPLPVFVNFQSKLIQRSCPPPVSIPITKTQQANNAAYIGGLCDDSGTIDHCLVFLKYGLSPCSGLDPGGSFAREALIIAHEYQHYVTDMISGIEFGSIGQIRVGDVIHEGYSDYFGASYSAVSLVGKYAFKSAFSTEQRELSDTSQQYNQSGSYTSPHRPGLVWASALWELRSSLGAVTVDRLAFKSLYYLSTSPGFIDSVEAVVQADKSLNGGVNEDRIRTLFFEEKKFLGSLTNAFQDEDKKIVKLGFQGCANIDKTKSHSAFPALAVFLIWLSSTLWFGKRLWRKL